MNQTELQAKFAEQLCARCRIDYSQAPEKVRVEAAGMWIRIPIWEAARGLCHRCRTRIKPEPWPAPTTQDFGVADEIGHAKERGAGMKIIINETVYNCESVTVEEKCKDLGFSMLATFPGPPIVRVDAIFKDEKSVLDYKGQNVLISFENWIVDAFVHRVSVESVRILKKIRLPGCWPVVKDVGYELFTLSAAGYPVKAYVSGEEQG